MMKMMELTGRNRSKTSLTLSNGPVNMDNNIVLQTNTQGNGSVLQTSVYCFLYFIHNIDNY